eukprot:scaffold28520_cov124-Isochrysis_galbana.AAC.5
MARSSYDKTALLDLPLEVLAAVCLQLDLCHLVCFAEKCKRFRHDDSEINKAELPIKPRVITPLRELAFPRVGLVPNTRPIGCSDLWVAYLARCARQHQREPPH